MKFKTQRKRESLISQKISLIQGMRAVAVLAVFTYHLRAPSVGAGFLGVDIFFVISGFVITRATLRQVGETGQFQILHFLKNRATRLVPALAVMVVFVTSLSCLFFSPVGKSIIVANTARSALLSYSNFYLAATTGGYFDESSDTNPLVHTWSLSVEDQFYVGFALAVGLLLSVLKQKHFRRSLLVVISVAGLLSLTLVFVRASGIVMLPPTHYYSPVNRVWEFAIGIVSALVIDKVNLKLITRQYISWLSILAITIAILTTSKSMPGLTLGTLVCCASTALIILTARGTTLDRLLSRRLMSIIGDRSYSIYLWHWPVIALTYYILGDSLWSIIGIIIIVVFLSELSYRYVEKPFLIARHRRTRFWAVPIAFVTSLAVIASSAIVGLGETNSRNPHWDTGDLYKFTSANYYPCVFAEAEFDELQNDCNVSKSSSSPDTLLFGDSHSGHLFPGVAETMPGRNFMSWHSSDIFTSNLKVKLLVKYLNRHAELHTVVMSAKWDEKLFQFPSSAWRTQLTTTARALAGSSRKLVLVEDVPGFPFTAAECAAPGLLAKPRCLTPKPTPEHDYMAVFSKMKRELGFRVQVVKTTELFCERLQCSMSKGGKVLYSDSNHLNLFGSRLVATKLSSYLSG